jgi:uncharacterized protein YndB with AHSA1/START domain
MSEPPFDGASAALSAMLVVRRRINATPAKLFAAWTQPELLVRWWGPQGVACPIAEIDLRVGGSYRIANEFPDGKIVWIGGVFEVVEPPHRLAYTWKLESQNGSPERVTVCFEAHGSQTEVIVTHERIPSESAKISHEHGWAGCLDGLVKFIEQI